MLADWQSHTTIRADEEDSDAIEAVVLLSDAIMYVLSTSKDHDESAIAIANRIGELCGVRPTVVDLKFADYSGLQVNLEFYLEIETKELYLYCELGNPGEVFETVELADAGAPIVINNGGLGHDVVIDNIAIYGSGSHGIGTADVRNVTVQYCTFEWIGGARHSLQGDGKYSRYGNAVESFGNSDNFVIHDCYASKVYCVLCVYSVLLFAGVQHLSKWGEYPFFIYKTASPKTGNKNEKSLEKSRLNSDK